MRSQHVPISREVLKLTYPELELADDPHPKISYDPQGKQTPTLTIICMDGKAVIEIKPGEVIAILDALVA